MPKRRRALVEGPALKTLFVFALLARRVTTRATPSYFDNAGHNDVLSGGVRRIPINTPKGTFTVWTKRVGNNPKLRVLLLHGGPGATHEIFEAFDTHLPAAGIEYIYYDQLGSAF